MRWCILLRNRFGRSLEAICATGSCNHKPLKRGVLELGHADLTCTSTFAKLQGALCYCPAIRAGPVGLYHSLAKIRLAHSKVA